MGRRQALHKTLSYSMLGRGNRLLALSLKSYDGLQDGFGLLGETTLLLWQLSFCGRVG